MNFSLSTLRGAGLFAALVVGASAATAAADLFPNYDSYIKITGQSASVTGNGSSFARRLQFPENGAYGIEALRINKELNDATSLSVEGKALVGKEDYLGAFKLVKNEVGTFDMGYKRYRTFYDGIGGFFPLNNRWNQLSNPELHTDRAKFWAEARIERPNAPKFEFRYTNELRTGRKDSTIWGDSDFTGIPVYYANPSSLATPLNPYSSNRKIVPNTIAMNDRQQNYLAKVEHHIGNTNLEFEILHNTAKNVDRRTVVRYPGELQLFPRQTATSTPQVYPEATVANQIIGYDAQSLDSKTTTYTGKFETKFTETVTVFGGLLHSKGSADVGGDRQMTTYFPTAVGVVTTIGGFVGATGRPAYSYKTTDGNVDEKILAANVGVKVKPTSALSASVSLKYEKTDVEGYNTTLYTSNRVDQTTGVITPTSASAPNIADRSEKSWIPEAEIRYTGIKNLALYGNFDYRHAPGEEFGSSQSATTGGGLGSAVTSRSNVKLNHGHYKVGANWNVNQMINLRGEIYYKDHTNGFYDQINAGDGYVLGYEFVGQKLSAVVKPQANLAFTTRLVRQTGKMNVAIDGGTGMDSNDMTNYQIGETIDWAPNPSVFVQANINVVYNTIKTGYPVVGGAGNDVLRNADNDYKNGSLITGYAISKDTEASIQYTFYRADNYKAPNYATQWYGAGVKEYTYALALKHRFSEKLVGQFKLGYFNSENQTTGGNTNYKGPMAYVSFDHAL